jgi:hypothetical protein
MVRLLGLSFKPLTNMGFLPLPPNIRVVPLSDCPTLLSPPAFYWQTTMSVARTDILRESSIAILVVTSRLDESKNRRIIIPS